MNAQTPTIQTDVQEATPNSGLIPSKKVLWIGRIMSTLPILMLLFSAVMKLQKPPAVVEGFTHFGIPGDLSRPLGILELACTIIYVIPQTAVLGAVLLTGYLGGAVMTNLRVGDSWIAVIVFGVFIWGGIFLREPRLRALFPFRK